MSQNWARCWQPGDGARPANRKSGPPIMWSSRAKTLGKPEIETDRARFLGRGREMHEPIAVMDGRRLSNTVGTVLDAIFALRYRVRVAPGATARIVVLDRCCTVTRGVLDLLDKQHEANAYVRAATLAWTQAQVQLRHIGIDAARSGPVSTPCRPHAVRRCVDAPVVGHDPARQRRAGGAVGSRDFRRHSDRAGAIDAIEDIAIARQLLRAHEYWRMKQLAVDLVILNERASSYIQDLQIALETQSANEPVAAADRRGTAPGLRLHAAHRPHLR